MQLQSPNNQEKGMMFRTLNNFNINNHGTGMINLASIDIKKTNSLVEKREEEDEGNL